MSYRQRGSERNLNAGELGDNIERQEYLHLICKDYRKFRETNLGYQRVWHWYNERQNEKRNMGGECVLKN